MLYKLKDKRERNERLVKYHQQHPDMTLRALAGLYRISTARIHQILKRYGKATT